MTPSVVFTGITYAQLLEQLQKLSPDQLNQDVMILGYDSGRLSRLRPIGVSDEFLVTSTEPDEKFLDIPEGRVFLMAEDL